MTMTVYADNSIKIDENDTGLYVVQTEKSTVVYSPGFRSTEYREHPMPHVRYSLACDAPVGGAVGRAQFEADVRALHSSIRLALVNPSSTRQSV